MNGLAKVAAEGQSFMDRYQDNLRKQYAKKYNLDPEEVSDEKMKEIDQNEATKGLERMVGVAGLAGGAQFGHKAHREGLLTGRRTFYHNTDKSNIDSIKQTGLQSSRAADPTNWTHQALSSAIRDGEIKSEDLNNKIYLANNPSTAFDVGLTATRHKTFFPKDPLQAIPETLKERKNVKIQMPLSEAEKLNVVANPELRGATNAREFYAKAKNSIPSRLESLLAYRALGPSSTTTIEGDIPSQFIKGGEGFNPLSGKEVFQHIKNHPGKFARGIGMAGAGLGLAGAGGHFLQKGLKETDYSTQGE